MQAQPGPLLLELAGLVVEELGLLLLEVQFEGLEPELWPLEQPEQELGFAAEAEFAAMGFLTPLCFLFWAA